MFRFEMLDRDETRVTVGVDTLLDELVVSLDTGSQDLWTAMTPEQARRLAEALNEAAAKVEGHDDVSPRNPMPDVFF